jgi:hypothetical protein
MSLIVAAVSTEMELCHDMLWLGPNEFWQKSAPKKGEPSLIDLQKLKVFQIVVQHNL